MGATENDCKVAGRTSSSLRLPVCGRSTVTGSAAAACVLDASALCVRALLNHVGSPTTQSTSGIVRNQSRRECFPAVLVPGYDAAGADDAGCCSEFVKTSSCDMGILRVLLPCGPRSNDREDRRHKEESGKCGEQQSADYGAAERSVLLAAFAQPESHGHHADNHGGRCHDDRAQSSCAGFKRRTECILCLGEAFIRKCDHQDAVCGGHTDAHDGAHQGRNAKGSVGKIEHPANARKGARQCG